MIASRIGLVVAWAIAIVLGVIVVVDRARAPDVVDRALVPGFDASRATGLRWTRTCAPGTPCIARIELKQSNGTWRWGSDGAPADRTTIDAVLAALRGATWHRRADAAPAGDPDAPIVELVAGDRTTKLAIGSAVGAQHWIRRDDNQYVLVDDWVVRALVPDPLALRMRRPLAEATLASRIVLERSEPALAIRIEGTPRRLVKPQTYWLSQPAANELEAALAALEVVALSADGKPSLTPAAANRWTITIDAPLLVTVELGGACGGDPSHVAIAGSAGSGCVTREAAEAVERAALAAAMPERALDLRPLPIEPASIALVDGAVLDLSKRPRIGDRDADPSRAAELVAALAMPGELVALPTTAPTGKLVVTDRSGAAHELALHAGNVVMRTGEPGALKLGAEHATILRRTADDLADTSLWTEEPTTIASIAIDGTTYTRGTVVGEWTRMGPGADLPGVVEQLAAQLSALRSLGTHAAAKGTRRLVVTIAPPSGAPRTRTIELVQLPKGCGAIVDGARHLIAREVCQLASRLR